MTNRLPDSAFRAWLVTYDPADSDPCVLTERFVRGLLELGIPVSRSSLWLPTAHPELWGTQVIWDPVDGCRAIRRDHDITTTSTYLNTPGEAAHRERCPLRWRLEVPDAELTMPLLRDIKAGGGTDYLLVPFHTDHNHEQPWITFTCSEPGGFSDRHIELLEEVCGPMGWKARVAIAEGATRSLMEVYLGRNAAARVLDGQFRRGSGTALEAVIWFCDLRGFTTLGDSMPGDELVALLDQYFEVVACAIEDAGGEILKFVGDAVLAVFACDGQPQQAAQRAMDGARAALRSLDEWWAEPGASRRRLRMGLALHIGEVLYGNIGGRSRLDFTVIGAAVNEAARVESLCKELGTPLLATGDFAQALGVDDLVSLGIRELRGVSRPRELFTIAGLAGAGDPIAD